LVEVLCVVSEVKGGVCEVDVSVLDGREVGSMPLDLGLRLVG